MTVEEKCKVCRENVCDVGVLSATGVCWLCEKEAAFAAFAQSCGLTRFPEARGERYVRFLDLKSAGKKAENTDFIDELWNALVRTNHGADSLLLPESKVR